MSGLRGVLSGFDIPASGMAVQRVRMRVISENLANATSTRTIDGGPYVRRYVSFASVLDESGSHAVRVTSINRDTTSPFLTVQDPGHADAGPDGNVRYPNVNSVYEMIDFNISRRSYEANLSVFRAYRDMMRSAIAQM